MLFARALVVWLVMLVVMSGNGAARDGVLRPRLGELAANQVSVLSGSLLIVAVTAVFWRWLGAASYSAAWSVGATWFVLTIAFEFLFGHFVAGRSWDYLLNDYNLAAGRLWPIALSLTLLAPPIMRWWRG